MRRSASSRSRGTPDARARTTESTSVDVWYAHPPPGWNAQRQLTEPREERLGLERRRHRPRVDAGLAHRAGERGVVEADAEAARHRQQVVDRDRTRERLGLVERALAVEEHPHTVELRDPAPDRVLRRQDAVGQQPGGEQPRHRLGQRGEAVRRRGVDRPAAVGVGDARGSRPAWRRRRSARRPSTPAGGRRRPAGRGAGSRGRA